MPSSYFILGCLGELAASPGSYLFGRLAHQAVDLSRSFRDCNGNLGRRLAAYTHTYSLFLTVFTTEASHVFRAPQRPVIYGYGPRVYARIPLRTKKNLVKLRAYFTLRTRTECENYDRICAYTV